MLNMWQLFANDELWTEAGCCAKAEEEKEEESSGNGWKWNSGQQSRDADALRQKIKRI